MSFYHFLSTLRGLIEDAVIPHSFILNECRMNEHLVFFNTIRREHLFTTPWPMHVLNLLYGIAVSQEGCQDFMKILGMNNWGCSVLLSSWEKEGPLSCTQLLFCLVTL